MELPITAADGTERLISWNSTALFDRDGRVIGLSSIGKDITEIKKKQEDLRVLSTMDSVTGLKNRRCFDIHLDREWRRALRNSTPLAVIMLDIDHFKPYNDTYGHIKGDECLRLVARALCCAARRAGDIVARFGGEEFAVVLPLTNGSEAAEIAGRMRQSVEELDILHESSKVRSSVTISAGVASMVPTFEVSHAALLEQADRALYAAKKKGRNCVMGNGHYPHKE